MSEEHTHCLPLATATERKWSSRWQGSLTGIWSTPALANLHFLWMFNKLQQHRYQNIIEEIRSSIRHTGHTRSLIYSQIVTAAGSVRSLFQQANLFDDCLPPVSLLSSQISDVSSRKSIRLTAFTVNRKFNPRFLYYWRSDCTLSPVHTTWLLAKYSTHQEGFGACGGEKPSLHICKKLWLPRVLHFLQLCRTVATNQRPKTIFDVRFSL